MVDKEYWDDFYIKGNIPTECSTFAKSVLPLISKQEDLFELGCGNGRDAFFFAQNGINVLASDISEKSIEILKNKSKGNPTFICEDFTKLPTPFYNKKFGTIYSRFTLHSVKEEGATRTLQWSYDNLKEDGYLFIEVRSVSYFYLIF